MFAASAATSPSAPYRLTNDTHTHRCAPLNNSNSALDCCSPRASSTAWTNASPMPAWNRVCNDSCGTAADVDGGQECANAIECDTQPLKHWIGGGSRQERARKARLDSPQDGPAPTDIHQPRRAHPLPAWWCTMTRHLQYTCRCSSLQRGRTVL